MTHVFELKVVMQHFVGQGTTLGCARGCAIGPQQCGPEKGFCLPAAPYTVALCYLETGRPTFFFFFIVLGIVFLLLLLSLDAHNHVDDYSGTLGGVHKVHFSAHFIFHISSHHHLFLMHHKY